MTLGERLKEARLYCDMKQPEVAEKMGINFRTISSWENDRSRPTPEDLLALSKIYDISIDSLLGNESRTLTHLPKNLLVLAAYNAAPEEIQAIVNAALSPYMDKGKEERAV